MIASYNPQNYVLGVLSQLIMLPGYIEDVAKHMIRLAAIEGENKTVECRYTGIHLHANHRSTVPQIQAQYEGACAHRRQHR